MSTELAAQSIKLPEGVTASLEGRSFAVKGKLGTIRKDFARINVEIQVEGGSVLIRPFSARKKDSTVSNTVHSIVRNMVKGVTHGYTYRLKVVYAHFPISVKTKGDAVVVENFVGERSPRVSRIIGDCKVTTEGDDVVVKGVSLEDVGQTSANLELATKIKRKDQRIFLDGIYIYQKGEGW
ncbi:MAG: 50S ribosomal protein L6 [Thaumarchaeota archaeon]|nr:MAG: 50S ribosomal protein L6 [Nitrososphaerota archaeon]TLY17681.1 MAG: 50S ribosomal protein L6 [Nitrososphaerota archaeon]